MESYALNFPNQMEGQRKIDYQISDSAIILNYYLYYSYIFQKSI